MTETARKAVETYGTEKRAIAALRRQLEGRSATPEAARALHDLENGHEVRVHPEGWVAVGADAFVLADALGRVCQRKRQKSDLNKVYYMVVLSRNDVEFLEANGFVLVLRR